jgi:methyl-accepting chemotaxis protein
MRTETLAAEPIDAKKLFRVLSAYERGDFSVRMPVDQVGITGKVYDALNHVIDLNERLAKELARISSVVGKAGNVRQRASLPSASGEWLACIDSVNTLVTDLVQPNTEVARVIGAVAKGDLSQAMALEIDDRPLTGEFLRTAKIVNTMVEQLSTFASEITRMAREVGTENKLDGQAKIKNVANT